MTTFTHDFDTPVFKKKVNFKTGIFIDNDFSDGANNTTIEYVDFLSVLPEAYAEGCAVLSIHRPEKSQQRYRKVQLRMLTARWPPPAAPFRRHGA